MSRWLIVGVLVGAGYFWWNGRGNDLADAEKSPNGFVAAVMPDGVPPDTVVILAPVNCPSDAAQRADALAAELGSKGIRTIRSSSYSSEIAEPTDAQQAGLERAVAVMNGTIPAVFVNGMAKANPTAADVVAEYRLTKSQRAANKGG